MVPRIGRYLGLIVLFATPSFCLESEFPYCSGDTTCIPGLAQTYYLRDIVGADGNVILSGATTVIARGSSFGLCLYSLRVSKLVI